MALSASPKNCEKLCELPPPMMSTFVLPGAQTIGFISGNGASPRPPSFGSGSRDCAWLAGAGRTRRSGPRPGDLTAAGSAPAVMATVAGTTSVSKLSSTIFDSVPFLPRFSAK